MSEPPKSKVFSFQIDVEAVPYNPDTVKYCFGKKSGYNPDIKEDCFASELVSTMIRDALTYVFQAKMNFCAQHKIDDTSKLEGTNKDFWNFLEDKEQRYSKILDTYKPIKG